MTSTSKRTFLQRIAAAVALTGLLVACGGGGGGGDEASGADPTQGSRQTATLRSTITNTPYTLRIYLPPASAGPRASLPVVYALDGESWFQTLIELSGDRMIVVAIDGEGQRNRDYVPANSCTPNGGGHARYFDFLRQELVPHIEGTIGGDPRQRVLFGHSHGGSLVLYALFAQVPGQHSFKAYLASDSSVSCMTAAANGWEQAYATAHDELPVTLHLSYATLGNHQSNLDYAARITQSNYTGFTFTHKAYAGSHGGIVPQALGEGLAFAIPASP